ncbi:hypothetical protein [Chitinophaga sp.]|uniref:hypothetical protein n=1 Tax=Chitinophaga sp. TaxID=1869181 RepID=UPI0031DD6FD4
MLLLYSKIHFYELQRYRIFRQSIMYLDMVPLQQPEFYLGQAAEKFDAAGNLTDDATKKKIQELWAAFASLIEMHAGKREA